MKNKTLKVFSLLAVLALSVPLFGCGNVQTSVADVETQAEPATQEIEEVQENKDEDTKDRLDEILERGYIIVGTEGTYAPNTYHNENDELVGFDVETAALIAKYIGVDVQYVETEWSSIFAALDAGQIDIIVNEVGYTDERAEKYDFSNPYAFVKAGILTRADDDSIQSFEDLSGKIAANESTSLWGERALSYGAELDPVNAMAQSISEVINERADATLNAVTAFANYQNEHPDDPVKVAVVSDDAVSISYIPLLKGNDRLKEAINNAIKSAQESGELAEISQKYFYTDVTEE